jgi:hypothetical protein
MKKTTLLMSAVFCAAFTLSLSAQSADNETVSSEVNLQERTIGQPLGREYRGTRGALVYDNGPHFNVPGNPNISLLQDQTLGQTTLGGGCSEATGFSIADDFVLTSSYEITAIDLYGYQTNAPAPYESIQGVYIRIWDDDPSAGGNVIFGDLSTNVVNAVAYSNTLRHSESNPGTTRGIQLVSAEVNGLQLDAGTYWIEWQYIGDGAFSGPWQPPVVELDVVVPGNAQQSDSGAFGPWVDGQSADPLEGPFQLYGTEILGVDDVAIDEAVQLFPNPVQDNLGIVNNSQLRLISAEIYNMRGTLVQTIDLSDMSREFSANVASLRAGVYLVNIQGEKGSVTKRFVKR